MYYAFVLGIDSKNLKFILGFCLFFGLGVFFSWPCHAEKEFEKVAKLNLMEVLEEIEEFKEYKSWKVEKQEEMASRTRQERHDLIVKIRKFKEKSHKLDDKKKADIEKNILKEKTTLDERLDSLEANYNLSKQSKIESIFSLLELYLLELLESSNINIVFGKIKNDSKINPPDSYVHSSGDLIIYRRQGVSPLMVKAYRDSSEKINITQDLLSHIKTNKKKVASE